MDVFSWPDLAYLADLRGRLLPGGLLPRALHNEMSTFDPLRTFVVAWALFSHDDGTLAGETSEMKWKAFAEVLTLLSVAASILYLGYEVRQASLTVSADLNQEIYHAVDGLLDIQMQSADLRSAILQARQSYDSLTPDQVQLHELYWFRFFNIWERTQLFFEDGLITEFTWLAWERGLTPAVTCDGWIVWERFRDSYNRSFSSYIEKQIMPTVSC